MNFVASTTPPTSPVSIAENGGVATVTLMLDRAIQMGDSALVFPLEEITGIQAEDIDGSLSGRSITVDPGSDRGTATITAAQDDVDEGANETMTVTLGTLPNNADSTAITLASGVSNSLTIIITDDDDPFGVSAFTAAPTTATFPLPLPASTTARDNRQEITLTVTLNGNAATNLSFPVSATGGAGEVICVLSTRDQTPSNCSDPGEPVGPLSSIEVLSGASVGTGTYFMGVFNGGDNAQLPTEGTFTITLPNGVASGGNDLSESVCIAVTTISTCSAGDAGGAGEGLSQ